MRRLQELLELLGARIDKPKNFSLLCDSVLISSGDIVDTIEESPVRYVAVQVGPTGPDRHLC